MRTTTMVFLGVACSVAAAASAAAQGTAQQTSHPKTDIPANLAREAKISLDSARTVAMVRVPKGTIQAQELERENGRLIYSFDMKIPGRSGIDEVNVNALNGEVVGGIQHEAPSSEAKEARAEKKEGKKP